MLTWPAACAGLEAGGQLLAPLEQETLLSWAVLILQTLEEAGVPLTEQAGPTCL